MFYLYCTYWESNAKIDKSEDQAIQLCKYLAFFRPTIKGYAKYLGWKAYTIGKLSKKGFKKCLS